MKRLSRVLAESHPHWAERNGRTVYAYCPACDSPHGFRLSQGVVQTAGDVWTFDGNVDAPTFAASMLVRWQREQGVFTRVCHSYVRSGKWEFLSDCTHALAGQTVPLPDFPESWIDDNP